MIAWWVAGFVAGLAIFLLVRAGLLRRRCGHEPSPTDPWRCKRCGHIIRRSLR